MRSLLRRPLVARFGYVVFACLAGSLPVAANQTDMQYEAHILDMPVSAALDALGRDLGLEFSGDTNDRRRIVNLTLRGTPEVVVEQIMDSAGMDAFTFGGQIYYSPESERAVRLIPLDDITFEDAEQALAAAGLIFPGFEVTSVANGGAMVLSGPVRYLALSEGVVNAVVKEPDIAETPVTVRRGGVIVRETQASVSPDPSTENLN